MVITPAIKNEIIIGRDDLKKLGVIPKQFPAPVFFISENQYSDMREMLIKDNLEVLTDDLPNSSMDTGCIPMKIYLTPGEKMPFRISTARQIPLHWREKAERIVKKLLDGGVLMRQDDPTEWCALGFFVAKKNGDLLLVVDYTKLKKYIRRPSTYVSFDAGNIIRHQSIPQDIREVRCDSMVSSSTPGWGQLQAYNISTPFRQVSISPRPNGIVLLERRILPPIT